MRAPQFRMFYKGQVVTVSWHEDPADPAEVEGARRSRRRRFIAALILLLLGMLVYWWLADVPVDYDDVREHFKYGSIGAEQGNGVPYRIWKVLPEIFPEYLPDGGRGGYAALGFTSETGPGKPDTPIGFSKRWSMGVQRVGLNCAVCHASTVRAAPAAEPRTYLAMPAHKVDLLGYFDFLFQCAQDERFTAAVLMARIGPELWPHERVIYRHFAIPRTQQALLRRREQARFLLAHPSGPGRIDTFTPYKAIQFGFRHTEEFAVGNADFPSIWAQEPRQGMDLHWDGNNSSVRERNISAAIGAGATPVSLDRERMARVLNWIWTLPPPRHPGPIDAARAGRGAPIYRRLCAGCHDIGAPKYRAADGREFGVGQVVPIALIQTDRERLDSYSLDLTMNQYTLGSGRDWRFVHFRKTDGYANMPLDGIWARAPYLHNGSVPTLRDLLEPPARRPQAFYRGNDVYDPTTVGFVSTVPEQGGHRFWAYDTLVRGNGNGGHTYGTDLPEADKDSLVEYLKTL